MSRRIDRILALRDGEVTHHGEPVGSMPLTVQPQRMPAVTDDIVTRLRRVPERVPKGMGLVGPNEYYQRCQDAADEIERLRNAIIKIDRAITDEGKVPSYHRAILKKHRGEWPTLHNAVDEARKAVRDDR